MPMNADHCADAHSNSACFKLQTDQQYKCTGCSTQKKADIVSSINMIFDVICVYHSIAKNDLCLYALALSLEVMTEHAKYGTQHQEKSFILWKDTGMWSMQLLSIIPMGIQPFRIFEIL